MKSFLILTVLCLAVTINGLSLEQEKVLEIYFKDCIVSAGANPEAVHKSRKGDFVDDPKVGEFVFCFFKRLGFMNDAGEVQIDVIKTNLSPELSEADLTSVVEKCKDTTGKDSHEKAYNLFKCYWTATPNHINLAK